MEPLHPLVVLGSLVGLGLLIFFVGPLLTRNKRKQDTLKKSARTSSADAAKTSGNGRNRGR